VGLLIDLGNLESAVSDTLFLEADGIHPLADKLRHTSLACGHLLWHSWHRTSEVEAWGARLRLALYDLTDAALPSQVQTSVPEGYAYYGVYPEMYLEAARRYHAEAGPAEAVCLGLRSIGTSLSAVVAAALEELGCRVTSGTIRPRGHPFCRFPALEPALVSRLAARPRAHYLVIDEGPGISGSSFGGVVAMLRSWGIEDDNIFLFPSWKTDGHQLRSAEARASWARHRQFSTTFEEVWLDSGRLSHAFPGELVDLSAGGWRPEVYQDARQYPAVHPQHERRKYLLRSARPEGGPLVLKFAGLGDSSDRKIQRTQQLAAAGFSPGAERGALGFVLQPFVPGTPTRPGSADPQLLETAASYLAHLSREYPAAPSVGVSSLTEMVTINVAESLQDAHADRQVNRLPGQAWSERVVALDGRMLAHEWIRTSTGYLKVDAVDHHEDHFFPGCQDIAWDVVATALELQLDKGERRHFVERYSRMSGDRTIVSRLPQYTVAYLSFRVGYTSMAATALDGTPDGQRFSAALERYRRLLKGELNGGSEGLWYE
jgi:hypothetical protein